MVIPKAFVFTICKKSRLNYSFFKLVVNIISY